jgi:hypothetical protein
MGKRRKINPVIRKPDRYNPTNLERQKALTIVGAFCRYSEQANRQPYVLGLLIAHYCSPLYRMLPVLNGKVKLEILTGTTEKHPSGNPHQISNTEGWYQNIQFTGSVLGRG